MNLQENPPVMYSNFERQIAIGGYKTDTEVSMDTDS